MKYILLKIMIVALMLLSCEFVAAQVGVMRTTASATLHVESKPGDATVVDGIIAPSLTRAQLIGKDARYGTDQTNAIVYVAAIDGVVSAKTSKVTKVGYYYFDGSMWQCIDQPGKYFYLPVFELPTDAKGVGKTYDLYTNVVAKQFKQSGNSFYYTNNGVLTQLPNGRLSATQFDYVITYYDTDVIKINSISTSGVVNYDVLSTLLGPSSFVNVVVITK